MPNFMLTGSEWQPWYAGLAKYLVKADPPGRGLEAGVWKGTPADMPPATRVKYKRDELIYVVAGRVRIESENGQVQELGPGEGAHFAAGETVIWTLLSETFEEFYVYLPRQESP